MKVTKDAILAYLTNKQKYEMERHHEWFDKKMTTKRRKHETNKV